MGIDAEQWKLRIGVYYARQLFRAHHRQKLKAKPRIRNKASMAEPKSRSRIKRSSRQLRPVLPFLVLLSIAVTTLETQGFDNLPMRLNTATVLQPLRFAMILLFVARSERRTPIKEGGSSSLVSKHLMVPVLPLLLIIAGDVELNPGPGINLREVDSSTVLSVNDLSNVMEELIDLQAANQERLTYLAQALGVHISDNFTDVVTNWLSQNYNVEKYGPPNWRRLVEVVNHTDGGNNQELAKRIAKKHPVPIPVLSDLACLPVAAVWKILGLQLGITNDHLSTIQANNSHHPEHSQMCLVSMFDWWLKNSSNPTYSELIQALDIIGKNDVARRLNEKHNMCIMCESNSLSLPSNVQKFRTYLKVRYTKLNIIPDDPRKQWPPTLGQHFYDLALMENKRELPSTSAVTALLANLSKGKISQVMKTSRRISLEDIFINLVAHPHPLVEAKILVTGVPGIGKTTLTRKICHEWGKGLLISQFSLVLLYPLREEAVYGAKDISDLIKYHFPALAEDVGHFLEDSLGQNTLFIFDGWDELPTKLQNSQHSLFVDMINNKVLPKCSVLVTARVYAAGDLIKLPSVTKHIDILGFTNKQVSECIRTNIFIAADAEKVLQQLKMQKHIMSACYVPLTFAIILHVLKYRNYDVPKTLTELHQIFVQNALLRHMKGQPDHQHIKALRYMKNLPVDVQIDFDKLCKLALEGLIKEKVTFGHDDISEHFPNLLPGAFQDTPFLGLLTSMQSFSEFGEELHYQFLHVTTQEFLAAWRITHHSDYTSKDQLAFLIQYRDNGRFHRTFVFMAGLSQLSNADFLPVLCTPVKYSDLSSTTIQFISGKRTSSNYILFVAEMLYEAQNNEMTMQFAKSICYDRLRIEINPYEAMRSLIIACEFLVSSERMWKTIVFSNSSVLSVGDSVFQSVFDVNYEITDNVSKIEELKLENFLSLHDIRMLINIPPFTTARKLSLVRFGESFDADLINSILNERAWLKFGVTLWDASDFNFKPVFDVVASSKSTAAFHFETYQETIPPPLNPSSQMSLCTLLTASRTLHSLHLTRCGIDCTVAQKLASALTTNVILTELNIGYNSIGIGGQMAIFHSLVINSSISKLILRATSDEEESLTDLTEFYGSMMQMFALNKTLISLDLMNCYNFDSCFGNWVATGLRVNNTLEELCINYINIPAGGVLRIFTSLTRNSTLKSLSMSGRRLPDWHSTEKVGSFVKLCRSKMASFLQSLMNLMQRLDGAKRYFSKVTEKCAVQLQESLQQLLDLISVINESIADLAKFVTACEEHVNLILVNRTMRQVLETNRSLQVMDLRNCCIHPNGIATGLLKNETLVELHIGGHLINNEGIVKIFESLCNNRILHKLMIDNVELNEDALQATIQMLSHNQALTSFGFHNESALKTDGIQKLLESLRSNQSLVELVLPEKYISHAVTALITLNHEKTKQGHSEVKFCCALPSTETHDFKLGYHILSVMAAAKKGVGSYRWSRKHHHS